MMGYSGGGSTLPISAGPLFPGRRSPEVVDPEEPALYQVVPQAHNFLRPQAHRPDVGRQHEGTAEELVICDVDDPVIGLASLVEVDVGGGELREPDHEIDVSEGIVGRPTSAGRLAPDARVRQSTERESIVVVAGRSEPGGGSGTTCIRSVHPAIARALQRQAPRPPSYRPQAASSLDVSLAQNVTRTAG